MRIGYPCMNLSIGCSGSRTFRLKSYSVERLVETVEGNLDCLIRMLEYNVANDILFFRITSDLVPFASHPVCRFDWRTRFREPLYEIGRFINDHRVRVSMHPDQFTLINSPKRDVFARSVKELRYHAQVLDLMDLDLSAKIQIHVGGAYGDKPKSIKRFVNRYAKLDESIRCRLVIENDDKSYTVEDCLAVHDETGLPVLLDVLHHKLNGSGESVKVALERAATTWDPGDGTPMVDYSDKRKDGSRGNHAERINIRNFRRFLKTTDPIDIDIMVEIKDKERSALKAIEVARADPRFVSQIPL